MSLLDQLSSSQALKFYHTADDQKPELGPKKDFIVGRNVKATLILPKDGNKAVQVRDMLLFGCLKVVNGDVKEGELKCEVWDRKDDEKSIQGPLGKGVLKARNVFHAGVLHLSGGVTFERVNALDASEDYLKQELEKILSDKFQNGKQDI